MAIADSYHQQVAPEPLTSPMSYSPAEEDQEGVFYCQDNGDMCYLASHRVSQSVQPQPQTSSFQHRARRSGVFTPAHPRRVPKPLTLRSPIMPSDYKIVSPSPRTFGMGNNPKFPRDLQAAHNPADRWKTAALRARQANRHSSSRPLSIVSPRYSSNRRESKVKSRSNATSALSPLSDNRAHRGSSPSRSSKMDTPVSFSPPLTSKSSPSEQSADQCSSANLAAHHRRLPSIDTASNYSLESDQGADDADLSITVVEEPIPSPKSTAPLRTRLDHSGHADVDSNASIDLPATLWTTRPLNSPVHPTSPVQPMSTPIQSLKLVRADSGSPESPSKSTSPHCPTSSSKLVKKKRHEKPCPSPKSPDEKQTKTLKVRRSLSQLLLRRKPPTVADVAEEEFCGLKGFHESLADDETEELQLDGDSHLAENTSPTLSKEVNLLGSQGPDSEVVERLIESNGLKGGAEHRPGSKSSIDLSSQRISPLRSGRRPSLPESPASKCPSKKLNMSSSPSLDRSTSKQPARAFPPDSKSDLIPRESDGRSTHVKRTQSFQIQQPVPSVSKDIPKSSLTQGVSKALERSFSQSHLQKKELEFDKNRVENHETPEKELSKRESGGAQAGAPSPHSKKAKTKDEPIARNLFMFWKKKKTSSIGSEVSGTTTSTEIIGGKRPAVLKISDPIPITLVPQRDQGNLPRQGEFNNEKVASVRKHDNPNQFKRGKSSPSSLLLQQQISVTRTRSDIAHFTPPRPNVLAPSLPSITRSSSFANQSSLPKPPRPPRRRPVAAA